MKQETMQDYRSLHSLRDYHNLHKKPMKKYHASQIRDTVTGRKKWAVVWFGGNGEIYKRFPMAYGMRSAVRLANRLQKEHDKKQQTVEMARNSYTIGI